MFKLTNTRRENKDFLVSDLNKESTAAEAITNESFLVKTTSLKFSLKGKEENWKVRRKSEASLNFEGKTIKSLIIFLILTSLICWNKYWKYD